MGYDHGQCHTFFTDSGHVLRVAEGKATHRLLSQVA